MASWERQTYILNELATAFSQSSTKNPLTKEKDTVGCSTASNVNEYGHGTKSAIFIQFSSAGWQSRMVTLRDLNTGQEV